MVLLTPQEVADLLKVTTKTIYNWIESGELKATKFGDVWRIDQSDIENKLNGITKEG